MLNLKFAVETRDLSPRRRLAAVSRTAKTLCFIIIKKLYAKSNDDGDKKNNENQNGRKFKNKLVKVHHINGGCRRFRNSVSLRLKFLQRVFVFLAELLLLIAHLVQHGLSFCLRRSFPVFPLLLCFLCQNYVIRRANLIKIS